MRIGIFVLGMFLAMSVISASAQTKTKPSSKSLNDVIAQNIKEIKKLKVGMTRSDLLKMFASEGGLSTGVQRTYVYQQCPYIKVDVEFEKVGHYVRNKEGRITLKEENADIIKKISKPYLDWAILD